jgi:hypothetical protein
LKYFLTHWPTKIAKNGFLRSCNLTKNRNFSPHFWAKIFKNARCSEGSLNNGFSSLQEKIYKAYVGAFA